MKQRQQRWQAAFTILGVLLGGAFPAAAQDTWDGGGGDDNFSTAANWNNDTAPNTADAPLFTFPDGVGPLLVEPTVDQNYLQVDGLTFGAGGTTEYILQDGGGSLSFDAGAAITNNNSTTQTIEAALEATGALLLDPVNGDLTINSVISGVGGGLVKNGASTLTLNGANTFDSGVTLNNGAIILGNNNALGTGTFTINDGAIDTFAPGTVINNDIDVNGDFEFTGIEGQTLTLSGPVDLGAAVRTLTITDGELALEGALSGSAGLNKIGAGLLTLTGDSSGFTGITTVDTGTLTVDGQLGGNVTVNADGTLMGTGTVTGDVTNNGRVAPGNSIGALTVDGDYEQTAGAVLDVEVDGAAAPPDDNDRTIVGGQATLRNGSIINVADVDDDNNVTDGQRFDVLQAGGPGITDEGVMVQNTRSRWRFILDPAFSSGQGTLNIQAEGFTSRVGPGKNIGIIADVLEKADVPDNDMGFDTMLKDLAELTDAQLTEAIDQLSAQPHGTPVVSTVQGITGFHGALSQTVRARQAGLSPATASLAPAQPGGGPMLAGLADDPRMLAAAIQQTDQANAPGNTPGNRDHGPTAQTLSVFARPYGQYLDQDGARNFRGFDGETYGILAGVDAKVNENFSVGAVFGYDRSELDFDRGTGSLDSDNFRVGPTVAYRRGAWFANAALTWGYHDFEATRNIGAPVNATAEADYEGYDLSVYVDLGRAFRHERWLFTPIAALQYTYLQIDDFTESGAAPANLAVSDQEHDSLRTRLGLNVAYQWQVGDVPIVPEAFVGWEHEYLADDADLGARFVGGGGGFTLETGSPNDDAVFFGGGASALLRDNLSLFVRYEGSIANDLETHTVNGGVTFRF